MPNWTNPTPEVVTYVVGDIHGCSGKLQTLLNNIDIDVAQNQFAAPHLVFVGDYVDRGEHSADVMTFVYELSAAYPEQVACLMGNHEQMMLDFLDDPIGPAKRWLRHGGLQTLRSFGVQLSTSGGQMAPGAMLDAAADLRAALGRSMLDWLRALPLMWNSNDLWVVHAGADPAVPMEAQKDEVLIWGTDRFTASDRTDGQWVVVGHKSVPEAVAQDGRIFIDTGAVYGRALTALRVDPTGGLSFISS